MSAKKTAKLLRLDKYLADMGIGSRTQIKDMTKRKLIKVNDVIAERADQKIEIAKDMVTVEGRPIAYLQYEYYMMNKPVDVVSATKDRHDQTVLDLIVDNQRQDLFPVGRLDKDTEGLLLITNDGELAHQLLSPKKHVQKQYYAKVLGIVTPEDVNRFKQGLDIGDEQPTLPAQLEILSSDQTSEVLISICEGRFHQIKRMVEAVDKSVVYLKRLQMGTLLLDEQLQLGEYRKLTTAELEGLKGIHVNQ